MEDVYDTVGAVPREAVRFENVIKPLIDSYGENYNQKNVLSVSFRNFYSMNKNAINFEKTFKSFFKKLYQFYSIHDSKF